MTMHSPTGSVNPFTPSSMLQKWLCLCYIHFPKQNNNNILWKNTKRLLLFYLLQFHQQNIALAKFLIQIWKINTKKQVI